jgi:hypothetical protein
LNKKGKLIKEENIPECAKTYKNLPNNYKDGDIIHCQVVGYDEKERRPKLEWTEKRPGAETVKASKTSIADSIDNDTIQKLLALRGEIEPDDDF